MLEDKMSLTENKSPKHYQQSNGEKLIETKILAQRCLNDGFQLLHFVRISVDKKFDCGLIMQNQKSRHHHSKICHGNQILIKPENPSEDKTNLNSQKFADFGDSEVDSDNEIQKEIRKSLTTWRMLKNSKHFLQFQS